MHRGCFDVIGFIFEVMTGRRRCGPLGVGDLGDGVILQEGAQGPHHRGQGPHRLSRCGALTKRSEWFRHLNTVVGTIKLVMKLSLKIKLCKD